MYLYRQKYIIGAALKRLKESFRPQSVFDFSSRKLSSATIEEIASLRPNEAALMSLPMYQGLTMPRFALSGANCHPFITALQKLNMLENEDFSSDLSWLINEMGRFYEQYQPRNALALLEIQDLRSTTLEHIPAYAAVLPWDCVTHQQELKSKLKSVQVENALAGYGLDITHGWAWSGPVSSQKLTVEAKRLLKVFRSIQSNGYLRSNNPDGDISASLLVNDNGNIKWQARVGQHRTIALAALNYDEVPIKITRVIKRSNVKSWGNVASGLFSSAQALAVFDNHFASE